jgi:hypothetical protein
MASFSLVGIGWSDQAHSQAKANSDARGSVAALSRGATAAYCDGGLLRRRPIATAAYSMGVAFEARCVGLGQESDFGYCVGRWVVPAS